ncbi:hypothetical protein HF325_000778 [Metschnikowia pulcherrima]|uniref:Uncharacterized protein n=1 Tax=Metschnikowia pulcherrima TaxID=27326 RepID=A0A8H7LCR0_9ASCO|nr:hypothetical protein HF325_000778 [Metschnikowia pulcherrima]
MTQEHSEAEKETVKPVFGASGRKIVYDKDGKPCRTCNTLLDFQLVTGKAKLPTMPVKKPEKPKNSSNHYKQDDPPDVEKARQIFVDVASPDRGDIPGEP